jgi:hypothetical protein
LCTTSPRFTDREASEARLREDLQAAQFSSERWVSEEAAV